MSMRGYGCNLTLFGCACNGPWYDGNGQQIFTPPAKSKRNPPMKSKEQIGYDELVEAGARSLAPDEFWCIEHPDGPLDGIEGLDRPGSRGLRGTQCRLGQPDRARLPPREDYDSVISHPRPLPRCREGDVSQPIPGPGYGPLEGAPENPGTQVIGPAGRPANTCATCQHFAMLSPGHAAICMMRWRGLPWTAAVPMTTADDSCELHTPHP